MRLAGYLARRRNLIPGVGRGRAATHACPPPRRRARPRAPPPPCSPPRRRPYEAGHLAPAAQRFGRPPSVRARDAGHRRHRLAAGPAAARDRALAARARACCRLQPHDAQVAASESQQLGRAVSSQVAATPLTRRPRRSPPRRAPAPTPRSRLGSADRHAGGAAARRRGAAARRAAAATGGSGRGGGAARLQPAARFASCRRARRMSSAASSVVVGGWRRRRGPPSPRLRGGGGAVRAGWRRAQQQLVAKRQQRVETLGAENGRLARGAALRQASDMQAALAKVQRRAAEQARLSKKALAVLREVHAAPRPTSPTPPRRSRPRAARGGARRAPPAGGARAEVRAALGAAQGERAAEAGAAGAGGGEAVVRLESVWWFKIF